MSNNSNPESKHNPPQRQLPNPIAEVAADWPELFQQMESNGCPASTAARIRQQFEAALFEILDETAWRDFIFHEIRQNLKLLSSSSPPKALRALDEIDDLASRLSDGEERQDVLRLLECLSPLRKSLGGQS